MNVQELIEKLKELDPETEVVIAIDPEGNGFNSLEVIADGYNYDPSEREIGLAELTQDDIDAGYGEEDLMEHGEPCVVLWP